MYYPFDIVYSSKFGNQTGGGLSSVSIALIVVAVIVIAVIIALIIYMKKKDTQVPDGNEYIRMFIPINSNSTPMSCYGDECEKTVPSGVHTIKQLEPEYCSDLVVQNKM